MLSKNTSPKLSKILILITFILCNCFLVISQTAPKKAPQEDENASRDTKRVDKIKPEEFAKNRANPKALPEIKNPRPTKQNHTKPHKIEPVKEDVASLGFTMWKLKKSQEYDIVRSEIIGFEKEGPLTPERIEGELVVEDGDLLRLAIELPTKGYLYVFNQEEYFDGSHNEPHLIYPLRGINSLEDNNLIEPNQPIYLPRQQESYCFRFSRGKEGKIVSETYTFLVTQEPLSIKAIECMRKGESSKGETKVICVPRMVDKKEFDLEAKIKEWSAHTEVSEFNLKNPNHRKYRTMSKAERESLNNKADKLTAQDPPPQKVYTVARKPTDPFLVSIPIYIKPARR